MKKGSLITIENLHSEKIKQKIDFERKIIHEDYESNKSKNDDSFFDFSRSIKFN